MRLFLLLAMGCSGTEPTPDSGGTEPEDTAVDDSGASTGTGLEPYGIAGWDGTSLTYDEGVVPYALATPLFSDYALKDRAMVLPEGTGFAYTGDDEVFDLPVGTRLLKSFLYPADLRSPDQDLRIIETRSLLRTDEGWEAEPWLWNDEGTAATFVPSGATMEIEVVGLDGEPLVVQYLVPQKNQCVDCHELKLDDERTIVPIGPKARHLNRGYDHGDGEVNQLEYLAGLGWLTGLPDMAEVPRATDARDFEGVDPTTLDAEVLDAVARDYLDINCAHCHNPDASEGVSSQLFLNRDTETGFDLGLCKRPGSAGSGTGGLTFDIVPGDHSQSILWYRMDTEEIGQMMPDLGRSVRHDEGVEIIAAWIDSLEGTCEE